MDKETKKCTKCGELKPLSEFYHNKNTKDGHHSSCKACDEEYTRNHPRAKQKEKEYSRRYYVNHQDEVLERNRKWRDDNPEKFADSKRKYYEENKESILEKNMEWYKANSKRHNEGVRKYRNKRRKEDVQFSLACALRSRLSNAVRRGQKAGSAVSDLGCSICELKEYLETRFEKGMSWGNWTTDGWHIDHILPLSSFDLTDREQLLKACHYTNLQPLWAWENFKKGSKIIGE